MSNVHFSVIIAVYNAELYIRECLDSVLSQTYQAHEIILYNDGSTDDSEKIIFDYMKQFDNIVYAKHDNQGPGVTRNNAIELATGDYVIILDSDDMLESITLEMCAQKIEKDNPDIVHYEYKELIGDKITYSFFNKKYAGKDILEHGACSLVLSNRKYYTWMFAFKNSFLQENNIVYSEEYLYEDNEFFIKACLCARKISLIHSPLHTYRVHQISSSRANTKSTVHYEGRLKALEKAIALIYLHSATEQAKAFIINHAYLAFVYCYNKKTPRQHKSIFLRQFVDLVSPLLFGEERWLTPGFKRNYKKKVFKNKKYFHLECYIQYHNAKSVIATIKKHLKTWFKKIYVKSKTDYSFEQPLLNDTILFLGFNERYTGNSRYLYEQMKALYPQYKYFYVTNSDLVSENERIEKESRAYYYYLSCSKVVVHETNALWGKSKRDDQIWIQTWHATTVKKIRFDTSEPYINKRYNNQKVKAYKIIQNWDYFITDCEYIKRHYKSCYLLKDNQLKNLGYPRVKYLIDNMNNIEYKEKFKKHLGIPFDKKVILYAPSWRDYNLSRKNPNYEYLLDLDTLSSLLSTDYLILFKDHNYGKKSDNWQGDFINVNNEETQDLILISDFIVTDYSSIIFDGIAIDIPFFIYANDQEAYEKARGVYEDVFSDLTKWEVLHEMDLCNKIKSYQNIFEYSSIKEKYIHQGNYTLPDFIDELIGGQSDG